MPRTKLEIIKSVVENHQYEKIKMHVGNKSKTVILDAVTANRLFKMLNDAPPENLTKLQALAWDRLCNMAWAKS